METKVDVLAVMDREIASLPTMASMAAAAGLKCDPTEPVANMRAARAAVAELIESSKDFAVALQGFANDGSPEYFFAYDKAEKRWHAALARITPAAQESEP